MSTMPAGRPALEAARHGQARARSAVVGLAVAALAGAAPAAPEDAALMLELPPLAQPYALGANGFVVGGAFYHPEGKGPALHWLPTSGVTNLGGYRVSAVSRDGKTLVGAAADPTGIQHAATWTGASWRLLGSVRPNAQPCDDLLSDALGTSGDGRVIVGLAWDGCGYARAFRFDESSGMADLGSLGGGSTRANGVSADGRVVVGWEQGANGWRQAARWVDGKEALIPGPGPSGEMGEALGTNRDGSLIVGAHCEPGSLVPSAWTWTPQAGVKCFPVVRPRWALDLPYKAFMYATSDDGRVIVGTLSFGFDREAVVWLDGEPFFLRDYLRDHGVPRAFDGWYNTGAALAVSADGRTLAGFGIDERGFQGYLVVLPELRKP